MNWQLDINILLQLLTVAAFVGMGWAKITSIESEFSQYMQTLEKDLERVEKEVIDGRELKSQLAIVTTKLSSIEHTLEKLITSLDRNQ